MSNKYLTSVSKSDVTGKFQWIAVLPMAVYTMDTS